MIAKYVLPWFAGGPAVWTTCMLFFQLFLLGGYCYAHLSIRRFGPRVQASLHGALLLAALLQLPITPASDWKPLSSAAPTWHILLLLGSTVGLPYFALSSTTPLMQAWFSQDRPGASPYRFYALSNTGSLLALLSYPFVFEPVFSRSAQSLFWAIGFAVFAASSFICVWAAWRHGLKESGSRGTTHSPEEALPRPSTGTRILWLALPACAAVLLLAVTNQITMDLVVVPFLWVLPLSLYLLTFILSFEGERWYARSVFVSALLPALIAALGILLQGGQADVIWQILVFSVALFVCCMVCHGELSRLKPHPRYLTGYYLMIALGGALGGVFVSLIAPLIFVDYLELHVGLLGTGALCFIALHADKGSWLHRRPASLGAIPLIAVYVVVTAVFIAQAREPLQSAIVRTRNFYGVLTVLRLFPGSPEEQLHLRHGRIPHGMQFTAPGKHRLATGYYSDRSGAGLALRHFPRQRERRIGLVGLGAGTLTVFAREGDVMRIYEINPEVRRLAESYFTYLKDSPAQIEIVMGDARLSMERDPPQEFDILLLDAFSGDAIPVHLLTREAFGTYLRHLKPDGVIALLIDTWHLDFEPVINRLAAHLGLESIRIDTPPGRNEDWGADWMLLARDGEFLTSPPLAAAATKKRARYDHVRLWTDDYTSLLPLLEFK
ncbi:MAG: spermidine synthase [Anaerolineae bacterium]